MKVVVSDGRVVVMAVVKVVIVNVKMGVMKTPVMVPW